MAGAGGTSPAGSLMATLLIVDDTPENLAVLNGLLSPRYRIRAVNSGLRALNAAATPPRPDLILLDVMMPDMDGYQVITHLKENPETVDIPVIFVTALDSADAEERGLALGAVDYIAKPIRPSLLIARVNAHIELQAARAALHDRDHRFEVEMARRMTENVQVQEISIRALARLAEIRDPETGHHLRRTQGYTRTLALELSSHPRFAHFLTPHNIEILVKSAPLHDIGKVGIPDYILHKPGRLSPQEWEVMKTHSHMGYLAIDQAERDAERPLEFLRVAKDITHYHHERWDGSGYPMGLTGDEIPIPARLMALADVFDALIAERVYKPALPLERALEIIRSGRGRHFDPDVVDAMFHRLDAFVAVATRHRASETPP